MVRKRWTRAERRKVGRQRREKDLEKADRRRRLAKLTAPLPASPPPPVLVGGLPLVHEGQVKCPLKVYATIARDACIENQRSAGCNCLTGQAARAERIAFDVEQLREEKIAAAVRARHHEQYVRWGKKWKPTGRPRGRPPRLPDWRDEDAH